MTDSLLHYGVDWAGCLGDCIPHRERPATNTMKSPQAVE